MKNLNKLIRMFVLSGLSFNRTAVPVKFIGTHCNIFLTFDKFIGTHCNIFVIPVVVRYHFKFRRVWMNGELK